MYSIDVIMGEMTMTVRIVMVMAIAEMTTMTASGKEQTTTR